MNENMQIYYLFEVLNEHQESVIIIYFP